MCAIHAGLPEGSQPAILFLIDPRRGRYNAAMILEQPIAKSQWPRAKRRRHNDAKEDPVLYLLRAAHDSVFAAGIFPGG
jgi:hypothetical protein